MITTPWHRLDPEITARSLDLVDSDDAGTRVPAATRAEILARLRAVVSGSRRCQGVVIIRDSGAARQERV